MRDRLEHWWFPSVPALRLATLRVLIVGFGLLWLIFISPLLLDNFSFPDERFHPVGVVTLLDTPLDLSVELASLLLTIGLGAAALLGWRFRVTAPLYALGLLWVTSYRNSWGMIFHTENLLVMHTLILAVLPAADAWSLDARGRSHESSDPRSDPRYGWGPMLMVAVTAIVYLLAGVAKLETSGWTWLDGEVLLGHVAWDNLRKHELGAPHSPLGAMLSRWPAIFAPLAWASLLLELGAPISLLGGRIARVWALGIWAFHFGVMLIMAIVFAYPLSGIAYAPSFAVERLPLAMAARIRARRPDAWILQLLPE